ncbi:ComEA family DNA-binding protein [Halomonas sp. 18H]|uniref:ComEA family DNA-binding protein n=1 Tax=Halomonas almeriensis TaxID=308163 RepID=UPI0022323B44|nr:MULTISPECIES: ComEA family DNA-binding protein [Halomonas]MCW4153365.1 ComEA family DNA-binding protein [Halomonas sp. 18H]MDN3553792.1 ComEA family DNA-binding protein [Halomonas almeriensis]
MLTPIKGLTVSLGLALLLGVSLPGQAQEQSETSSSSDNSAQLAPININSADAAMLTELPGIGEVKAASIVDNREANGPFTSASELTRVSGIGEATVEGLEDQVSF